jgi:Zn-dependent peptidase ImmA (M78 family)
MELEYPEQRIAKRLHERFDLKMPVDVSGLAARYADVRRAEFPVDVDGVSVGLKQPGVKPRIYLNKAKPRRRQRFTLAHELGHVLIPWHVGTIVDDVDVEESDEHSRYWDMEEEANRFATELLMPESAVRTLWRELGSFREVVEELRDEAKVSVDAATLRTLRLGPPGYVVVRSEGSKVIWGATTEGTLSNRPCEGEKVSRNLVNPHVSYDSLEAYGGKYHYWQESDDHPIPAETGESWRDILDEIVQAVAARDPVGVKRTINGIVAFANSSIRLNRSRDRIYAAALQKTRNRSDPDQDVGRVTDHRRFPDFLVAKIYSLKL